jgi:hypothetical protein
MQPAHKGETTPPLTDEEKHIILGKPVARHVIQGEET